MSTFTGSITTTGKSEAIRLDKALFRLHPEFRQKAKVRAQFISPGLALISVIDDEAAPARDPNSVEYRLGNTLGPSHRYWRRAKFLGRFRLFYRFSTVHKANRLRLGQR